MDTGLRFFFVPFRRPTQCPPKATPLAPFSTLPSHYSTVTHVIALAATAFATQVYHWARIAVQRDSASKAK